MCKADDQADDLWVPTKNLDKGWLPSGHNSLMKNSLVKGL